MEQRPSQWRACLPLSGKSPPALSLPPPLLSCPLLVLTGLCQPSVGVTPEEGLVTRRVPLGSALAAACAPSSLQVGREAPDPTRPPARPASLWEGVLGSRACPVLHQPCFICYFCLIHHKGPGTCVRGIRDVVLCFTMLNGQTPFVCFLFNSVFVRTIFSEAALINNGCAAHVSTLLIFYAAPAPTMLSALLRLKAFVPQSGGAVAAPPLAGGRAWRALGAGETGQAAGPLQRPVWAVSAWVVPGPALSPGLWGRSEGSLPRCCSSPGLGPAGRRSVHRLPCPGGGRLQASGALSSARITACRPSG